MLQEQWSRYTQLQAARKMLTHAMRLSRADPSADNELLLDAALIAEAVALREFAKAEVES